MTSTKRKRRTLTAKDRVRAVYPYSMTLECSGGKDMDFWRTFSRWSHSSNPPGAVIGEGKTRAAAWADAASRLKKGASRER